VLANGILSPGASVESLAVGATTFSSGSSIFAYEVDSTVVVGSGSAADLLVSNGNLSIGTGSIPSRPASTSGKSATTIPLGVPTSRSTSSRAAR